MSALRRERERERESMREEESQTTVPALFDPHPPPPRFAKVQFREDITDCYNWKSRRECIKGRATPWRILNDPSEKSTCRAINEMLVKPYRHREYYVSLVLILIVLRKKYDREKKIRKIKGIAHSFSCLSLALSLCNMSQYE